jgi:phospholipid/cholesterol/gamma-HCH transport system ATP-binding protein
VVVVTREQASIFTIDNNIFLDGETRTMITGADPKDLMAHSANPTVQRFWTRGEGERS